MTQHHHSPTRPIIGRFAPSPTGRLHLGSLTTALASYCHIKSLGGQWLLRIEDVDFERCKREYSDAILSDLQRLGLHWDGQVSYQSEHLERYHHIINDVLPNFVYACQCSRKQIHQYFQQHAPTSRTALFHTQDLNAPPVYPRLCLHAHHDHTHPDSKIRLVLPNVLTAWRDGIQGVMWDNPAYSLGDVVIKRQNGMINYIFACAIDDGMQNISHVMRGLDILPMTVAQLCILKACQLPTPDHYSHLPLIHNPQGQKLSKQNLATAIDSRQAGVLLVESLKHLKQPIAHDMHTGRVDEILKHAVAHWDSTPLSHQHSLGVAD